MDIYSRRLEIFKQVETGALSLDEATRRLEELDQNGNRPKILPESTTTPAQIVHPPIVLDGLVQPNGGVGNALPTEDVIQPEPIRIEPVQPDGAAAQVEGQPPAFWQGWWLLLFIPGLLLVLASANWMTLGFQAAGLSWGFWLSFVPFGLGVLMMWLGWEIHLARWLHINVRQRPGAHPKKLNLSFPLPTGLVSWGIRRFGHFASPVSGKDMADFLDEVDQAVATDGSVHIYVNDRDGERVEIWIDGPRT